VNIVRPAVCSLGARQAKSDPHPEGDYRVIGTRFNMPEFRAAFHCLATDAIVRKDSCQIW